MNLAEIRKKAEQEKNGSSPLVTDEAAGPARQPEPEAPQFEAVDDYDDDSDYPVIPDQTPEESASGYDDTPGDIESMIWGEDGGPVGVKSVDRFAPLPVPDSFSMTFDTEADKIIEEIPASAPVQPQDATVPLDILNVVPVSGQSPVFDPLSILLAGRKDSGGDDETSARAHEASFANDLEEYLCFRVADEKYALSIMAIKEIIKPREVTEVPRMPRFVIGVISLRGVIIPVMDMRLRLALPIGVATGKERVVVLRTASGFCGILVDEVIQVVKIYAASIEDPPAVLEGIDREFVTGLGRFDNRMLILLNLENILNLEIH